MSANNQDKEYNSIFETLVGESGANSDIVGIIAYGRYKQAKREWAAQIRIKYSRGPTDEELRSYVTTWTQSRLDGARQEAEQVLVRFADEVVAGARPGIEKEALRGTFLGGALQSATGSFIYSLLLLLVFFIINRLGVDMISLFSVENR